MDWIAGLQRAIDFVEEHLTEEIDYEAVAKEFNFHHPVKKRKSAIDFIFILF